MDAPLELEVVEVEELGDEDVGVEPLQEPGAPQAATDAKRPDPGRPLAQSGIAGVRRHVADRLAQLGGQVPDEVSPVVPVLAALGVKDDPALAPRPPPKGAILPPAPVARPDHYRIVHPRCPETSPRSTPGAAVTVDGVPVLRPPIPAPKERAHPVPGCLEREREAGEQPDERRDDHAARAG